MRLETESPVLRWTDIRCAYVIAICAAIGTTLALTIAASIFSAPTTFLGGHPIILDSQVAQARLEPREKAFYALAIVFSCLFGLIGSFMQRHFRSANWVLFCCIVLDCFTLNYFSNQALNLPDGVYWGVTSFLLSFSLAIVSVFGGKFLPLSHR